MKAASRRTPKKKKERDIRGLWRGSISFGLVNIPIVLVSAQQTEKIHFRLLDKKDMAPIGYKTINKRTRREVQRPNITKAFEYEKGAFVVMTAEDFKKANVKATSTIDIEDFVMLEDVDPLLFERPYYVVPQSSGEKGYALLRAVLSRTGKAAIAKIVLHTVQRLAAIMVRGDYLVLEILRFADEIKEVHEVDYLKSDAVNAPVSEREIKVATQLVEGMTSGWEPDKYRNTYREDLMKLIENKIKRGGTVEIEEVAPEEMEPAPADLADLTSLLKKSLTAAAKRPKERRPRPSSRSVH